MSTPSSVNRKSATFHRAFLCSGDAVTAVVLTLGDVIVMLRPPASCDAASRFGTVNDVRTASESSVRSVGSTSVMFFAFCLPPSHSLTQLSTGEPGLNSSTSGPDAMLGACFVAVYVGGMLWMTAFAADFADCGRRTGLATPSR